MASKASKSVAADKEKGSGPRSAALPGRGTAPSADAQPSLEVHLALPVAQPANVGISGRAFEDDLRSSLAQVRASLSDVFGAVGANVSVPQSISRQFGLDKSLASKIARVVRESDPFASALDMPGDEAMRTFARAMKQAGAPLKSLELLRDALDSFRAMTLKHCGDRATLEVLASASGSASGANGERSAKADLQQVTFRRQMFRGASATFGIQARIQVSSHFVAPSRENPAMLDLATVGGLVGLRRMRPDLAWAVASMRSLAGDGSALAVSGFEPIDAEGFAPGGAPLMREFCSQPIPELRATPGPNSVLRFELPEGPVGSTHAVNLYTGWLLRGVVDRYWSEADQFGEHLVNLSTPVEAVLHDLFVHRDLISARKPGVFHYHQLPGGVSYPHGPRDRGLLPITERMQDLSGEPPRVATADLPEYSRLTERVFERLGRPASEFYGIRIRVEYPAIPSMLLYRYELDRRPV